MQTNKINKTKDSDDDKDFDIFKFLETAPDNQTIRDNLIKADSIINNNKYKKIICSISGGADSDLVLDICSKIDKDKKIDYVWFDTGLEYQATKDHLKYLEDKYNIKIKPYKAIKPIPLSCREYGQPFLSKRVSEYLSRLQKHNFKYEDESFEELYKKYPNCKIALFWWCNSNRHDSFNINHNKWLKEFIIANQPTFKVSNNCCDYAKKNVVHKCIRENEYDLAIVGVRKAEGGARSTAYKNCFDEKENGCDNYRPLFWYFDNDKVDYEKQYDVTHSECYTKYGLKRTGCAGCPYGKDFEFELNVINKYEPKLYKAVNNIFGNSYEYTRKYKEFCKRMDNKYGSYAKYLREKNNS